MKCVICNHGTTNEGTTTVTFEREGLTFIVNEVPAQVCTNCGEDYGDDAGARDILSIAEQMTKSGAQVYIRKYVPGPEVPC